MNKTDKKRVKVVLSELKTLTPILNQVKETATERKTITDVIQSLSPFIEGLEDLYNQTLETYEDKSDKFKESYKGEVLYRYVDNLERAFNALTECQMYLELITEE